ncbi:hypothetical protein BC827DRAFT_755008 [Russula dissimulans]|nr:hypothetical protein BC827DRAFT_755008 [Russula dissimulans]
MMGHAGAHPIKGGRRSIWKGQLLLMCCLTSATYTWRNGRRIYLEWDWVGRCGIGEGQRYSRLTRARGKNAASGLKQLLSSVEGK